MAEVAYAVDDLERATEYTHRAIELTRLLWGDDNRELNTRWLLLARIALHREDLNAARELLTRIRLVTNTIGSAAPDPESAFFPSDQVLFEMVELAITPASDEAWDAFMERVANVPLQPHEELEVLEARACAAFRGGAFERSRALFRQAVETSRTKPNLMGDRVARNLAKRFAGRA